jgi:hypothetical protein
MQLFLKRLRACECGNALLVSAATLPLLIGSSALAYDTVQLALWTQQLQQAAVAGAAAGARALAAGEPVEPAVERTIARAARLRIVLPPRVERRRDTIRVVLVSHEQLLFLGALLDAPPAAMAEATARVPTAS